MNQSEKLIKKIKKDIINEKNDLIPYHILIRNMSKKEIKIAKKIGRQHYLNQLQKEYPNSLNIKKKKKKKNQKNNKQTNRPPIAYVDGSFNHKKKMYGSGIVIIKDNKIIESLSYPGARQNFIKSDALAGELIAVIKAIEWAKKNNYQKITICYDCRKIKELAFHPERATTPLDKSYITKLSNLKKNINIEFKKIKAHSNNKYNDIADNLAYNCINTKSKRRKIKWK